MSFILEIMNFNYLNCLWPNQTRRIISLKRHVSNLGKGMFQSLLEKRLILAN
jgi:hypothetical protein